MARGRYNRRHKHGVLRKKFATRQFRAKMKRQGRAPGVKVTAAHVRKPGHGISSQRALGHRPKMRSFKPRRIKGTRRY